jgi:hypothetical protein
VNDIIPQDSFITYDATFPHLGDCTTQSKMIFFGTPITITKDDYSILVNIFDKIDYSDLDNLSDEVIKSFDDAKLSIKNLKIKQMNNAFFNINGTKDGPGLGNSNDTLPLVCTPVEDEKGNPVGGRLRLDWIKGSFESIDAETKNIFYLIAIVAVLIGFIVFLHSFLFKNLGKILGDDTVVTRSASLN